MATNYTPAITVVVALVVLLTGMVTFVLSRPSDLEPRTRLSADVQTCFSLHNRPMTNTPANAPFLQDNTEHSIHMEQLKRVELFNGRAAMLGLVIGVLTEAITGSGIAHQIGLGALTDGYAACRTQFLPFCF